MPGSDVSPEVAADCQIVGEFILAQDDDAPDRPELEGEISDDYKDFIQGLVDDLQDLDVETDEVQSGIDAVVDFSNGVIDSDTWTEEIDRASADAFTPLTNVCAATFAEMDEDG